VSKDKVKVYFDRTGNTLTIWFDDPLKEAICAEVGDDTILMKDKQGHNIGLELLNFLQNHSEKEPNSREEPA
jgi:hypothetical protein